MYAEILTTHHTITQQDLSGYLSNGAMGLPMAVDTGKQLSRVYAGDKTVTFAAAFDSGGDTLVLARWLDDQHSNLHVERRSSRTSQPVHRLCEDVDRIGRGLLRALRHGGCRPRVQQVQLFEDSGSKIGVEGRPFTLRAVLEREWKALRIEAPVATLLIAVVFQTLALETAEGIQRLAVSALVGLGLAITLSIIRIGFSWLRGRNGIAYQFGRE
jgi:hypothetical protein